MKKAKLYFGSCKPQMREELRRSIPAKITAIFFILLILLINIWITYIMTKSPAPDWLVLGLWGTAAASAISFMLVLVLGFWWHVTKSAGNPPEFSQYDSVSSDLTELEK